MNQKQWDIFCEFKKEFKEKIQEWNLRVPDLQNLQKIAAQDGKTPAYPIETPIVYNRDLDRLTMEDNIALLVIGDNPGKNEQLEINNRYLVGQAGKIADGFFKRNPELNVDFRKNVIILNKTPVHSAKTAQLKKIMSLGGKEATDLIMESQSWMAKATAALHEALCQYAESENEKPELWLVGYSELKKTGFFIDYKNILQESYKTEEAWNKVLVFQHFSMNRFMSDLNAFRNSEEGKNLSLREILNILGNRHKAEIFTTTAKAF